jgi:Gelsolin repeat
MSVDRSNPLALPLSSPSYPILSYPRYGQFYGGDSYVVLYTYMKGSREEHIIYFWLGHTSSKDEIGTYTRLSPVISSSLS